MTANEFSHPLGRFLAHLRLQLDLEHAVREQFFVGGGQLRERPVDPDIGPAPVVARAFLAVPVVFADERELRVERDANPSVSRKLESGSVVEGADNCAGAVESVKQTDRTIHS